MIDWKIGYAYSNNAWNQYGVAVNTVAVPGSAVYFNDDQGKGSGASVMVVLAAGDTITLVSQGSNMQYIHSAPNGSPTVGSSVRVLTIQ